jgi:hypothetical protein
MSAPKDHTTYRRVNKLLAYDPHTGILTWRIARSRWHVPGDIAGSLGGDGYCTIMVDGKAYKAHRLAWLLHTGKWPKQQLDHINRVKDDNRIKNLREVSQAQNKINSNLYRNNKSGYRGVYFHKLTGTWAAGITKDGKSRCLGRFATAEQASKRYEIELKNDPRRL